MARDQTPQKQKETVQVRHNNPTISEDALRIFNTKNFGHLPDEVMGPIATIEIKRRMDQCKSSQAVNSASVTIFTTPSDKDFYLVAASLSVIKDVTSTSTSSSIRATVDGVAIDILSIASITLTVQNQAMTNNWSTPIKLDRNTTIRIINSTATANITTNGTVQGYTVETSKSA